MLQGIGRGLHGEPDTIRQFFKCATYIISYANREEAKIFFILTFYDLMCCGIIFLVGFYRFNVLIFLL